MKQLWIVPALAGLVVAAASFSSASAMTVPSSLPEATGQAHIILAGDSGWASRVEGRSHLYGPPRKYYNGRMHYYRHMRHRHHHRYNY